MEEKKHLNTALSSYSGVYLFFIALLYSTKEIKFWIKLKLHRVKALNHTENKMQVKIRQHCTAACVI